MNKITKSIKIYSLSLSILFLISIISQIGGNSLFYGTHIYAKNFNRIAPAGQPVTLNATIERSPGGGNGSGSPINFTWLQIKGEPVLHNNNQSVKGPVLSFKAPIHSDPQTLQFKVIATTGKASSVSFVTVEVQGDQPPIANAGNNTSIKSENFCNTNERQNDNILVANKTSPPNTSQILLDGSKSSDKEGPLKYHWTQIGGLPKVNIINPNNATTSFKSTELCNITNDDPLLFRLDVTDSVGQTDYATVLVTVNKIVGETIPEIVVK